MKRAIMVVIGAAVVASCEPWKDEDLAALANAPAYTMLSGGLERTCGIASTGEMYCWGQAILGTISPTELCYGPPLLDPLAPPDVRECATRPIRVYGSQHWVKVAGSINGVLAIDDTGQLWGWGYNQFGVLAQPGASVTLEYPRVLPGTAQDRFIDVSSGWSSACGVTTDHRILCWGDHNLVTAGVPTTCPASNADACATAPAQVGTAANWKQVVVGDEHACALDDAGAAWCWGNGAKGQIGSTPLATCSPTLFGGTVACRPAPTKVTGTAVFTSLSASGNSTCGLTTTGNLLCWGTGPVGTLSTPVAATGFSTGWVAVSSGGYQDQGPTVCGIRTGGTLWCFGQSQLGGAVHQVAVAATLTGVTVGGGHACAWDAAGSAWCFGDASFGALGSGTAANGYRALPAPVGLPWRD